MHFRSEKNWAVTAGWWTLGFSIFLSAIHPAFAQQSFPEQSNPIGPMRGGWNAQTIPRQLVPPANSKEDSPADDGLLTETLTDFLHNHDLPLVGARVLRTTAGRKVILYGYVWTEAGHADAVKKTLQFLGDPQVDVENRIIVQTQLHPQSAAGGASTARPGQGAHTLPSDVVGCWEGHEILDSCEVVSGPGLAAFTPAIYRLCYLIKGGDDFDLTLSNSNLDPDNVVWMSLLNRLFQHTTMDNIDTRTEIVSSDGQGNVQFRSFYHFDENDRAFGVFSLHSTHAGVQTLNCQIWPKSLHCTIDTHESENQYDPWIQCHSHAELTKVAN